MPKKSDANQPRIMAALRQIGATVLDLHKVGHGCPDLLVSTPNTMHTYLVEVKMPGKNPNLLETIFQHAWPGHIYVVHNEDEAIRSYRFEDGADS